jgi:hypothetical protein
MASYTESILLAIVGLHVVAIFGWVIYMKSTSQQELKEKKD